MPSLFGATTSVRRSSVTDQIPKSRARRSCAFNVRECERAAVTYFRRKELATPEAILEPPVIYGVIAKSPLA
jgi:hypothetical protein